MNESNLIKLYDKADTKKLVSMFDESIVCNKQAIILSNKAESITEHVEDTVKKRFGKIENVSENNADSQLKALSKQWSILSASLVKVKRSIQLSGFHSENSLWINPEYGIKEYKRHVKYSPFNYVVYEDRSKGLEPYCFTNSKLIIDNGWNKGIIDFTVLRNIPQIDQSKIDQFIEITEDTVHMINSWRNFFGVTHNCKTNALQDIKYMSKEYTNFDPEEYRKRLVKLDELLAFKKKLSINLIKQKARWELVIEKWKTINKNFLVLNELRKSELKI